MGLILVDTCLVVYAFEDHPVHGARVRQAFSAHQGLAVSPLVELECLVSPMRHGNLALQRYYEDGLAQFHLLDMPEPVFLLAAAWRARFNLKTPDALRLATAQFHGCSALWTNDERLTAAACGLAVNLCAGTPSG